MQGDIGDHDSLVAALKQVDVVISTVGGAAVLDGQLKLIDAIEEVGHIKVIPQDCSTASELSWIFNCILFLLSSDCFELEIQFKWKVVFQASDRGRLSPSVKTEALSGFGLAECVISTEIHYHQDGNLFPLEMYV